jgi:hypothetical protein
MASSTQHHFSLYQVPNQPSDRFVDTSRSSLAAGLSATQPRWCRRIHKGRQLRVRSIPTIRECMSSRGRPLCAWSVAQGRAPFAGLFYRQRDPRNSAVEGTQFFCLR